MTGFGAGPSDNVEVWRVPVGWPLVKVISGGQSGADIGGVKAGKVLGYATGGSMPHTFLTENGHHPEYAELYGMIAIPHGSYQERTRANVLDSDGTVLFGDGTSAGSALTIRFCRLYHKPHLIILDWMVPNDLRTWIVDCKIKTLNVAGNREGTHEGIELAVISFLMEALPPCPFPAT